MPSRRGRRPSQIPAMLADAVIAVLLALPRPDWAPESAARRERHHGTAEEDLDMSAILAQARTGTRKTARGSQRSGRSPPGRRDVEANANAGREQLERRGTGLETFEAKRS